MTNTTYALFLDDIRKPKEVSHIRQDLDWVIVKSYKEFVEKIENYGLPTHISFDHDLCHKHYMTDSIERKGEDTGYHAAKWLVDYIIEKYGDDRDRHDIKLDVTAHSAVKENNYRIGREMFRLQNHFRYSPIRARI